MKASPLAGIEHGPPPSRSSRRALRSLACLLAASATLNAAPRPLWAQPTPANAARADKLFAEARDLMTAGKVNEACPKFAESQQLDPSVGTLLNLGDCYERQGRFASAITSFLASSQLAIERNDADRSAEGRKRASQLEAKASRLVVHIGAQTPGLVIKQDGAAVEQARLGAGVLVDPGVHVVTAEASGYETFKSTVQITAPGQTLITVPALTPLARGGEPATPAAAEQPSGGGRPITGYVVGGLGVAAIGVGSVFGLMARSNYSNSEDYCREAGPCPDHQKAEDLIDKADGQAWVSNVGFGVGVVGVAVGTYLLFFAPSKKPSAPASASVGLGPAPAGTGLGLSGRF
jgi:tetratricopeptide (TPR) repeat protein